MSYMPVPIFQYFDSSRHLEVTEQGVASSMAESLQIISWTTGNDLWIVFAHYIFFSYLNPNAAKICSMQQNNTRVYMDVCARVCVSLSSEKPATVTIAFNDLVVKTCSQLRTTTHWVSFVTLVFASHYVLLFQQNIYCNLNEGFGLMSRDTYRAVPCLEVTGLASLWSVAHCPAPVHVLKIFSCTQNGPRHCLVRVAWFGEHMPWKWEDSPMNQKAVDQDMAAAWHSLNVWVLPSLWPGKRENQWGKNLHFKLLFQCNIFLLWWLKISACKSELNLLCRDWKLSPPNLC